MKDLKHLIYFENLLEDANNELVRQAQADGSIVLGYTCYHIPEVLLNVDNCISVRLRAPKTGSLDISTYYMSNYTCDYARALVERAIEGGYQFLDALIGVDACSAMNRAMEHFEVLKVNSKEKFFVTHTDMPLKVTDYYIDSYTTQMREHVLNRLTETFGVDTSDEALRKAVAEHNEVCKIISEIAEMRKLDNPIITGYEFHVMQLASLTCPKYLVLPLLRETLEESGQNKPSTQAFAVLADFSSAFLDGVPRYVVILRAVNASGEGTIHVRRLPQDVLERAAERIMKETPRVYRVVYDLSAVPPAHVEWE